MTVTENAMTLRQAKQDLAANIERMRPQIEASLPPGVDASRFTRVVLNAIQTMPELLHPEVDRQSVYNACLRGAQLGLMPDKREGAIVIVNEKRKEGNREYWVKVAQFRDMIGGLRKLAAEFGFDIVARSVYDGDHFDYQLGDDERIDHKPPKLGDKRGELIGCYAIATRLRDGHKYRLVMDMQQVAQRKAVAQTQAVWNKWPAEMGEKTVARALFKILPLTEEAGDEAIERYNRLVIREDEVETTAEQAQAAASQAPPVDKPKRRPAGLDAVAAAAEPEPLETDGEVVDAEFVETDAQPDDDRPADHF